MRSGPAILLAWLGASSALAQESGWHAADAHYGAEAMAEARRQARAEMGGQTLFFFQADRLEYQSGEGDPLLLWDADAWLGGDIHKVWIKTEGEYLFDDGAFEEAELQALYSRAVGPFFDLQGGVRQDFEPEATTYAVLGVQGLAPYWFEIDATAFLSEDGDLTARIEAEYELLFTQRLVLQPRTELEFAAQDVRRLGIGAGLSSADLGVRLRYEIVPEVAPYIGVSWSRKVGDAADFARAAGEEPGRTSFVAGIRLWF